MGSVFLKYDVQLVEPVTETPIQHARKRALSGQQMQAGKLTRTTKRKLCEQVLQPPLHLQLR
jgi:hypothetical protein